MKSIKEINELLEECPETVFDTFDLTINTKILGHALRDRIIELSNLYGRISQLYNNAVFLLEKAKIRRDKVETMAWANVDASLKVTAKKIAVKDVKVIIDKETTTLNQENERVVVYEYIASKGKEKMKEMSAILDVGRTLLSWDKTEQTKVQY